MNKKQTHFKGQLQQFKHLSKQVNRMLKGEAIHLSTPKQQQSQNRLKQLFKKLSPYFGQRRLRRILASAVFILGSSYAAQAQITFTGPVNNPFGLASGTNDYIVPSFVDMDGDGDLDIMASQYESIVAYYQNVGTATSPAFNAPILAPFNLDSINPGYQFITMGDLDGDGDFDMVAMGDTLGIKYFQNIGTSVLADFAAPVLDTLGLDSLPYGTFLSFPDLVDLDGDGDLDMILGDSYGTSILYFENTGTVNDADFTVPTTSTVGLALGYYWAPTFGDLDGDGDLDLIAGFAGGSATGDYYYQENTGSATAPAFSAAQMNPFGILSPSSYVPFPVLGDLDGDGDLDLLTAEYGTFVYYTNETPVGIDNPEEFELVLAPNPATAFCTIQASLSGDLASASIEILDLQGRVLQRETASLSNGRLDYDLDLAALATGVYLVQIQAGPQRIHKRLVKTQL